MRDLNGFLSGQCILRRYEGDRSNGEEVGLKIDASMVFIVWYKHFSNSRKSSKENIASMTREGCIRGC